MRTFIAALLLTSVVLPTAAYADPEDGEGRSERRAAAIERVREAREQRAEEPRPQVQRVQRVERVAPRPSAGAADDGAQAERFERVQRVVRERRLRDGSGAESEAAGQSTGDSVREWRLREREARRLRDEVGPAPLTESSTGITRPERRRALEERLTDRVREPGAERGTARTADRRPEGFRTLHDRRSVETFRHQWRRDHRYDWRRHRDRHRSLFRLGWYYDPFGWGYRRFDIGWNMRPIYWSDRYWLQDPWQWRLPTVYGPYRWIRYYDDALLIDLRSGRVVDVIHDVFW